ncbi:hypothetical protein G3I44_06715 [Halogeometricum borinquense]|uniref:PRC-barrel domain-containing protein n=1 Tax=Halogeometricum borinquense TaxID=60847 RepID=A0A6C0UHF2_9EURY|nr:PRC-barrel domain-containing protein [Halogeometricum borinquense]QIB74013.1 hypothetical protein G3I44_06715 [Halogeometricum borinquense]
MVPESHPTATVPRGEPVPDLSGEAVYTHDGYRLGEAVGVTVDLDQGKATGLLVADIDENRFPNLPTGNKGVSIPYPRIDGIGDVIVVDVLGSELGASPSDEFDSEELSEALSENAAEKPQAR